MDCSTPGFPVHHQLPELAQTHVHQVGDAIQPYHSLLSPSLPAFSLSQHQGFSIESVLQIRWPKYWNFNFSINPSNKYSGLISFMIDWSDVIAVQLILKNLLQHQSWKALILQHSAIFIVHSHIHTWLLEKPYFWLDGPLFAKLCLLFHMLSRMVIAFLPRSKHFVISGLQSPLAMILEPPKMISLCFHCFPHLFALKLWDQMPWS